MIDSHVHFWRLAHGRQDWITPARPRLCQDFLPPDFEAEIAGTPVTGCVAIQAAACIADTSFLLELADRHDVVKAVIGWTDLTSPDAPTALDRLCSRPILRGVRPTVPEPEWLSVPRYAAGLTALAERDLLLEALVRTSQLGALAEVARGNPELRIIVNHAAKPEPEQLPEWRARLAELRGLPNVYCKVSGLTQQSSDPHHHARVFDELLAVFGLARMLWGSDYPVLLETSDMERWLMAMGALLDVLSPEETLQMTERTARELYQIAP